MGGESDDDAVVIQRTAGLGYLFIGPLTENGEERLSATCTDSLGHFLWQMRYSEPTGFRVHDVQPVAEGGYIAAGSVSDVEAGADHVCLMRLTETGDTIWTKVIRRNESDGASSIRQTADGGYILGGWTVLPGSSGMDICLLKTDSSGNVRWCKTFGGPGDDWATEVCVTRDSGYAIAAQGSESGGSITTLCLLKTDSSGELKWYRRNVNSALERVHNVVQSDDGGFVVSGVMYTNWYYHQTMTCLYKLNQTGDLEWVQRYVLHNTDAQHLMLRIPDYGYILGGYRFSLGSGPREIGVIKASHDGEPLGAGCYVGCGMSHWDRSDGYWRWIAAGPIGLGLQDYFCGTNPPIEEKIAVQPAVPMPERSERHEPLDSFSNVWLVSFALRERQRVKITVHDTTGRAVKVLANEEYCTGKHGETIDGWSLPSGIYFVRVESKNLFQTQKIALIR
jgi:hypothetical protein